VFRVGEIADRAIGDFDLGDISPTADDITGGVSVTGDRSISEQHMVVVAGHQHSPGRRYGSERRSGPGAVSDRHDRYIALDLQPGENRYRVRQVEVVIDWDPEPFNGFSESETGHCVLLLGAAL
jgi:hypothetical protein